MISLFIQVNILSAEKLFSLVEKKKKAFLSLWNPIKFSKYNAISSPLAILQSKIEN